MEQAKNTYNLSRRFKILFFLSGKNDERSITFAKHFANSINIIYITPDNNNLESLEHPNIEIYCYKGFLGKLGRITKDLLINRVKSKIKNTLIDKNLEDYQAYMYINSMIYAPLFKNSALNGHFDFIEEIKDSYIEDIYNYELTDKLKSVSTLTSNNLIELMPYLKPVFKIFDGIENKIKTDPRDTTQADDNKKTVIGCYLDNIEKIDTKFINELAWLFSNYSFLFFSKQPKNLDLKVSNNVSLLYDIEICPKIDYILLPFENPDSYDINKLFYQNLFFNAPMLAIYNEELRKQAGFIHLFEDKNALIQGLRNIETFKSSNLMEKEILESNIGWHARASQLEAIILAYS